MYRGHVMHFTKVLFNSDSVHPGGTSHPLKAKPTMINCVSSQWHSAALRKFEPTKKFEPTNGSTNNALWFKSSGCWRKILLFSNFGEVRKVWFGSQIVLSSMGNKKIMQILAILKVAMASGCVAHAKDRAKVTAPKNQAHSNLSRW